MTIVRAECTSTSGPKNASGEKIKSASFRLTHHFNPQNAVDSEEWDSSSYWHLNIVTEFDEQQSEVVWTIEGVYYENSCEWSVIKLKRCNKNIFGHFELGTDEEFTKHVFGDFDSNYLPFHKYYFIRCTSIYPVTVTIHINYREPGEELTTLDDDLDKFFQNQDFCDVVFSVAGEEFPAHKQIISARNDVFAKMFRSEMVEKKHGKVEISDIEPHIFKLLLRFIYSERLYSQDTQELLKVMVAADKYSCKGLVNACGRRLIHNMDVDNAVHILIVADLVEELFLKKKCIDFIVENGDEVCATEAYKEMVRSGHAQLLSELFCRAVV